MADKHQTPKAHAPAPVVPDPKEGAKPYVKDDPTAPGHPAPTAAPSVPPAEGYAKGSAPGSGLKEKADWFATPDPAVTKYDVPGGGKREVLTADSVTTVLCTDAEGFQCQCAFPTVDANYLRGCFWTPASRPA